MAQPTYTREHLEAFAIAAARRDVRRHPRTWVTDTDVLATLRGHALCFANAHRVQVVLSADDLAAGLTAYRRESRIPRPRQLPAILLPLVSVLGHRPHRAA